MNRKKKPINQDDKTTFPHKSDALDDLERLSDSIINPRISALLAFYKQFLTATLLEEKAKEKQLQIGQDGSIECLLGVYEMFPHIPKKRINSIYSEVAGMKVEPTIEILLTVDPNEIMTNDDEEPISLEVHSQSSEPSSQSTSDLSLTSALCTDIDPAIAEIEMEYIGAIRVKNLAKEEFGLAEEESQHEYGFVELSEEELNNMESNERELYYDLKLKRDRMKKESEFIAQKLKEEKRARKARILCEGELEHLAKNTSEVKRYNCRLTSEFELIGELVHYRLVESQFYRLLARTMYGGASYKVDSVEYILNPTIFRKFFECKKELAKKHNFLYESMNCYLLFHGTSDVNMENIIKTNFLLEKVGSSTDMGYYGKGFYFSENPGMSIGYSRGNPYLLLCLVMVGKAYHMTTVVTGRPIEPGYDSHVSPDGCSEVVIFNPDQVIPMYKFKYSQCQVINQTPYPMY